MNQRVKSLWRAAVPCCCILIGSPIPKAGAQGISRIDSVAVLRDAQHAQWEFERHRRFGLPALYTDQGAPCDLVGRFCVRHGGFAFDRIPVQQLTDSRETLKRALDSAATLLPGDDWIAGQRVRYLIDADEAGSALGAANACRGTRWWCAALRGLALHVNGRFSEAEAAFDSALADMPSEKRCEWTDLSPLLEEDLQRQYAHLRCDERANFDRRIWRLADPLFLTAGNERRTEHLARNVWAETEREAVNTYWLPWAPDLREMVVKFGWSEKWTREPAGILDSDLPVVNAHEHEPNYHFFPLREPPRDVKDIDESIWSISDRNPVEAYAPRYARIFARLEPQVARFRRGDSTLIVAAYRSADFDFLNAHQSQTAMIAMVDDSTPLLYAGRISSGNVVSMALETSAPNAFISVETLPADGSVASRWRAVVARLELGADGRALSDLLFYEPLSAPAETLEEAAETAYGTILHRNKRVALYWEIYGRSKIDTVFPVALTLTPVTDNPVKRVIHLLRLGEGGTPIRIKWTENGFAELRSARSITLDLSRIPAGRYEVRLQVGSDENLTVRRIFEIL